VAFSGGLDSSVLLHALARRRRQSLAALHINHALHPQADHWQRHCEAQCAALRVPLRCEQVQVVETGAGLEAAARDARYACFRRTLPPGGWLLQAHHLDDQAETLLLRLLRGAGLAGLAGIPEQRALGEGHLLRPLLQLPRSALAASAGQWGLHWINDPSNSDMRLDRNYLRHEVLPLLEARWPGYRRTFRRAAGFLADAAAALPVPPLAPVRSAIGDPGFSLVSLQESTMPAESVRLWLRERELYSPPAAQLREFLGQLTGGGGAQMCGDGWLLERYRDAVFCRRALPAPPQSAIPVGPGADLQIPGVGRVVLGQGASPGPALDLRFRRGGERLALSGGGHLRLKTLFQDHAVPPWWRDRVPLLFAGDELLAVGPLRRSARAEAAGWSLSWEPPLPV